MVGILGVGDDDSKRFGDDQLWFAEPIPGTGAAVRQMTSRMMRHVYDYCAFSRDKENMKMMKNNNLLSHHFK